IPGLKRLRQQLNVRPNSTDPTESAQATRSLAVVYEYVEESPECTQLLKIWEWQQQHDVRKIEASIVEVLSKLIHQCNTALHRTHAMKITRSILQNQGRMTAIYKNLSCGRLNTVQATLRLLTAMNHVHQSTTRELKDGFNFGLKALSKLKNQRRKEGEEASNKTGMLRPYTRTIYIQFLLAFFIRGDATVKKEVLEMPDLFQAALKDIYNDPFTLIKQVLTVLTNNISQDNDLSRTVKLSFFNTSFLMNLLRLYARTEAIPGSDQTVAQEVHGFMMALCTTPGVGVCFQDAAWYPPSTLKSPSSVEKPSSDSTKHIFNKTLSQLLTHLRPTENIFQQELTVSILTACPELVRPFWQKMNIQMEPRLSARWLANMTLLHKITEIPVPNLYLQHTGLFASHPPPVSTMIENILPGPVNRTILSKGLQHSSILVRYFTVVELAAAFQKTEQVIAVMQSAVKALADDEEIPIVNDSMDLDDTPTDTKAADPPAQKWAAAITLLLAELRRRVPDLQIIISLHNGIQSTALTDTNEEERTRHHLFNNGILRLIKYYQRFLPQVVSESKFDVGKLIPSNFSTVQAGTLIHLLELLLALNDFRWSNKSQDGSSSHLVKLFSLFLTTAHPQIKSLTKRLISKLLGESILFQHDPSEPDLWVEALPVSNYGRPDLTSDQTAFLHFLDDCVARCLRTPYKYVDQSTAILSTLQDSMAIDPSQQQNFTQSFSPLLMTVLEQFQYIYAKDTSKDVACSIAIFLYRLLPSLVVNQNRTPALALECLNRIQEPSKQDLDKVIKLNMEKRRQITRLDVTEYLAMTSEALHGKTIQEPSTRNDSKKITSNISAQQLKSMDNSSFMAKLPALDAASIGLNFKSLVEFACKNAVPTECLLDHIQTRFPFAGSIYNFPDVAIRLRKQDRREDPEQDVVYKFLGKLPFPVLLRNTGVSTVSNSLVQSLMIQTFQEAEPRQHAFFADLIIRQLAWWIECGEADESSVKACFALLTSLLESSSKHKDVFGDFKSRLWGQFILRELYLYYPEDGQPNPAYLDTFNIQLIDLLVASTKSDFTASSSKTNSADLFMVSYYIRKTVDLTDLTMLLQSVLSLRRQTKLSTTSTFDAALSIILKTLAQQGRSASAIPVQSTAALLDLWRERPTEELDAIVLEGRCVWSSSASEQDRSSVKALRPVLLSKLVHHISGYSLSTHDSVVLAKVASIFVSLTTNIDDEDEVAAVWTLIEGIPRVGEDSIVVLRSLLEVTRDVSGEQEQLDRQDRLARWFEEVARRLTVVLDKNGDVEWLEPVCDQLYTLLENHAVERKLSIDQRILFELVSFAIEKALDNVELIRFSAYLAKHYYAKVTSFQVLPQILQTLFKHRQFSSLIMATEPTTKYAVPENFKNRLAIIELIYTLTSLEPETCCKAGFLPTLLAAYSASTSTADQLVLSVLRITESQTAGSISNRAPLWGSAAENTKASSSLFGQAMINESLELIDPNMMMSSVTQFPLDRELECMPPLVINSDYCEESLRQREAPIYDPCFMLPLFSTYMAFGNQMDCRRLIEVNGLGMIIVALSSLDENMRLAAYSLLDDFYGILMNATMREKNQLVLLLDSLKNSIVDREDGTAPPRIPAVITTFVAHALSSLLKPDHFMYPHVNKFCLQRPTIDLEDIPMFYSMFNSSSEHHRKERVWMLRLLASSLKTAEEYRMFKRRHVIDLLVAFFNSQLSEPLSKKIVIEVLFNATSIPKVSLQLITQSAFLSWLH
ncbi:MAG: ribosome 60S biogenesis N-terminal-domain-containing protein, partial [Benniella sp.]